ncbi:MAG: hypothetical protein Q9195_004084 [Heterodermia aff. obscurata]
MEHWLNKWVVIAAIGCTLVLQSRNQNHTLITRNQYRIPNTDTILELRYGGPIQTQLITTVLSVVLNDITDQMHTYGAYAWLPYGQYDYVTDDQVEFSAYSPPELPPERQLTWQIVHIVVDGLVDLLVLQQRHRAVSFKIKDGPDHVLVGYGHIVQNRGPYLPMIRGS